MGHAGWQTTGGHPPARMVAAWRPQHRAGGTRSENYLRVTVAPAPSRAALAFSAASLVDLLQDRLGRAVDEVLGLLQAEAGQRAHLLDDLDLLVAGRLEDDVELVLLLGGGEPRRRRRRRRARRRRLPERPRGDAEGVLELLHELGELEEGHLLERVEQLVGAELRHGRSVPLQLVGGVGSAVGRCSRRSAGVAPDARVGLGGSAVCGGRPRRPRGVGRARRLRGPSRTARPFGPSAAPLRRSASTRRAVCASGAANSDTALASDAFIAPASLASSTSRDSRSASLLDLVGGDRLAVEDPALDHEQRVGLGEVAQALGGLDRVTADEGDRPRGRPAARRARRARPRGRRSWSACSSRRRRTRRITQGSRSSVELGDGEPAVLGEHGGGRSAELLGELGDCGRPCRVSPCGAPFARADSHAAGTREKRLRGSGGALSPLLRRPARRLLQLPKQQPAVLGVVVHLELLELGSPYQRVRKATKTCATSRAGPSRAEQGQTTASWVTLLVRLGSTGTPGPMVVLNVIFFR